MVALALASAAGCGIAAEGEPQAVAPSPPGAVTPVHPRTADVVQVYLVRDDHLVPVPRTGRSAADAVTALLAGPTDLDAQARLASSLPALPMHLVEQDPDLVVIELPPAFTGLPARDLHLAAAQLVWTATDVCCATQVQMRHDDRPVLVPTDEGVVTRPVRREDYRSVAPL